MSDIEKLSVLSNIIITRNLILRCFAGIYLCAFLSFYVQAEGLFSPVDGILPAQIEPIRGKLFHDKLLSFFNRPNWIRILRLLQVATFPSIELICLSGVVISFFAFITTKFCTTPVFAILWTLFYSLVDISSDFHHQSDDLLLEAGLVCVLLAPMLKKRYGVSDNVMIILMRWVLFRFLFTSGAVKLASGCPHWWSLNAIKHHLLTMPLPTNLAFYSYYLSDGWLKLTTIYVNLSELLITWFFFAPVRSMRIFAFYWLLFLQITIIATGNYGYLNFMIIAMLFSLLDDNYFRSRKPEETGSSTFRKIFSFSSIIATIVLIGYITNKYYRISYKDGNFDAYVLFTRQQYMGVLRQMVKFAPFIATISIINVFLQSCISHPNIRNTKGIFAKLSKIIHLLALTLVSISLIGCSTVPHGKLHPDTNIINTTIGKTYEEVFNKYHIVHEYGLHLRKMRSERYELGIQWTEVEKLDKSKPKQWKEFDVTYRPVQTNRSMIYAGPYFSRIDFRFYEAVGKGAKLERNMWLANFVKHLLRNSRAALVLLGRENLGKMKMPPKFIRVVFLKVAYVARNEIEKNPNLFTRKILNTEYLPAVSLSSQELNDLIKNLKLSQKKEKETYPKLLNALRQMRVFVEALDGHIFVNSVLAASFMIMFRFMRKR
ncbi:hypothetical protein PVAND_010597 [Polypedilum vanderplanki]|uniref:Lipase maturation factor n=1 Tax=Polypedilum vanderplanki TaxID=319348 RepID=A0A9J6CG26_POLVA|nr:hypothetical protein PVAND_010597 [Polypedilum vanderplanki]